MYLTPPRDIQSHQSHPTYSITVLHPSRMAILKDTFSGIGVGNVGLWVLINDHESFRKCIRERGHINQFRQVLGGLEKSLLEMARAQIKVGDHPRVLKRSRPAMRFCKGSKVSKDVEMSTGQWTLSRKPGEGDIALLHDCRVL